jgi:hypothetical protein
MVMFAGEHHYPVCGRPWIKSSTALVTLSVISGGGAVQVGVEYALHEEQPGLLSAFGQSGIGA